MIGFNIAIIILMTILLILYIIKILKIKKLLNNLELNSISNKFPDNSEVCKSILKILDNENVNIKINDNSKNKTSLYIVMTNTIFIANIKDIYTRIQTVAHECIHSIQDKKLLWLNFLLTNIYALYFIIAVVLTITRVIEHTNINIIILVIFGILQFSIRSFLELDAMINARCLAQKYMNEYKDNKNIDDDNYNDNKEGIISKDDVDNLCLAFDSINNIGIPLYMLDILIKSFLKPLIYSILIQIMNQYI